ncbi:MAG: hypothetical protein AAB363_06705, partial [Planctomycetota bacterium]
GPAVERGEELADLVRRYLSARIEGRTVFGGGFYGWSVFAGLGALWLSTAAAGWLARYHAAVEDAPRLLSRISLSPWGSSIGRPRACRRWGP